MNQRYHSWRVEAKFEAVLAAGRFTTMGEHVAALRAAGGLPERDLPL